MAPVGYIATASDGGLGLASPRSTWERRTDSADEAADPMLDGAELFFGELSGTYLHVIV